MLCAEKVGSFAPLIWLPFKNQTLPVTDEEVNKTDPPGHNNDKPEITGMAGTGLSVTIEGSEVETQPLGDFKVTV